MTQECCAVVEVRQYTLRPGARDTLIDLFDTNLVESQEATGMHIVGQFRDVADPDRFVWLRGFESMPARQQALGAFYGGPVWAEHRETANATMIDSDNVLLLQPIVLGPAYPGLGTPRPATSSRERPDSVIELVICELRGAIVVDAFAELFRGDIAPALRELDADLVASFATLHEPNTFPALPVRDTEALVWLIRHDDQTSLVEFQRRAEQSPQWKDVQAELRELASVEVRLLQPTARSQLR